MSSVTCAYYDVSELADNALMARAMKQLPWSKRRERAQRFLRDEDRRLCVGAGLLAADMLRRAGATDLSLAYGTCEKPYLSNYPNLHFNISHSGTYAACAVSSEPVGVDIEEICDHGRVVAEHCFLPHELSWLYSQADTARAFTRLWVRKESYIKLVGTGLSLEPLTFSVVGEDDTSVTSDVTFTEFEVGNCLLCTCTTDDKPVDLRKQNPFFD